MRYQTLQVSRAIAAIGVVAYHASFSIIEDPHLWGRKPLLGLFDFGYASVEFFFVLSGFIIFAAHLRDIDKATKIKNYLTRRFIRVYPIYWVIVIPVVLTYLAKPGASRAELISPAALAKNFLLVGPSDHASLAVTWTLFHEVAFYALFALLILNRRFGTVVLIAWWVACAMGAVFPTAFGGYYMLSPINLLFAGGMGAFWLTQRFRIGMGFPLVLTGCALFLGTGIYETQFAPPPGVLALYGTASVLILVGLVWMERRKSITISSSLVLLGDASYCIYLSHYPVLSVMARLWIHVGRTHWNLSFLSLTVAAVIPGILLHLIVEKPLLRKLNTLWHTHSRGPRTPIEAEVSA